jgi:hypothetical protein
MARPFLDLSSGFKTCPRCKIEKALNEFHKSRTSYHGITVYCKQCSFEKHRAFIQKPGQKKRAAERSREWRAKNPERQRDHELKSAYGLPHGTYERMLEAQDSSCAICKTKEPGGRGCFHLDHCHSTGTVRGLLCHHCNIGIGHLGHDPERLQSAIRYLIQTSR